MVLKLYIRRGLFRLRRSSLLSLLDRSVTLDDQIQRQNTWTQAPLQ